MESQKHHGLTIVALLDDDYFKKKLDQHLIGLQNLDFEISTIKNSHSTLLGLIPAGDKRKPNPKLEEIIYDAVKFYLEEKIPKKFQS